MGFFHHCQPNRRFNAYNSDSFPRGPTIWHTIDWDQRKFIATSVPQEVDMADGGEEVEERVIQALAGLVDELDPDVHLVKFSIEGTLISTSSDAKDDSTLAPLYCPIEMIPDQHRRGRMVSRSELVELDRLSPCVDLVSYRSRPGSRAVFKYQFHPNQALRTWHELNCWLRLTGHPHIVPLDAIITDYIEVPDLGAVEVVVGFTSVLVHGMTVQDNPSRLFKLKHLEQLINVVDDLNLEFGIVHQDIAPRNLLISPVTDTLQLFDFSCAGKLGWEGASEDQNLFSNSGSFKLDLIGVVATAYEIITRDTHLAEQVLMGAEITTIEEREWVRHPDVVLETDVVHYRQVLQSWMERRKQPENLITHYTQAPNPMDWPQSWRPKISLPDRNGGPMGTSWPRTCLPRTTLKALGLKFVEWERPSHNKIPDGFHLLGNGTLIAQTKL